MTGPVWRLLHSSGRFDAKPAALVADLADWTAQADAITRTEVSNPRWFRPLDSAVGWERSQSNGRAGERECAILCDSSLTIVDADAVQISKPTGSKRFRLGNYAYIAVLRHSSGGLLILAVRHAPAHVEGAKGWRKAAGKVTSRVRLYRRETYNYRMAVERMRAKYPTAAVAVAADWNLNTRRAWVRAYLRRSWPTYALVFPAVGTHGNRAIDGWVTFGLDVESEPEVLPARSSDHRAVVCTFTTATKGAPMPKRGFMPGAIDKEIKPGANDPAITPVGGVLHVAVSEADSLHDYFDGPSGGVESHFYVRYDGTIEQYRSIYREADANLKGNSFARGGKLCGLVSIETEGLGDGEWTPEQLASIKRIIRWCNKEAGVPFEVIRTWNGNGWGWHTMFGAPGPWTPSAGKTCPGSKRIAQFKCLLAPWLRAGGRDPVANTPSHVRIAWDHLQLAAKQPGLPANRVAAIHAAINALEPLVDTP